MDLKLEGKCALVTGAAHGLGKAICLSLASEGVNVVINYRGSSRQKAETTAEYIKKEYGVKAICLKCDITNEDEVSAMFKEIVNRLGGLDILINNAGVCPISMVKVMSYSEWKTVIGANLDGTFLTSREMINTAIELKKPGVIINIISPAAFIGSSRGKSHYAASKGGVLSFSISLAKEVAKYNIRVNALAPGMLYTEMTAKTLDEEMDKYINSIPIGRIGRVEEIARVVTFIASDLAGYVTGAVIDVSGGLIGR